MNDYTCGIDISSQYVFIREIGIGTWPYVNLKIGDEVKIYLLGSDDSSDNLKIIDFGTCSNFREALEKCLNEFRNYFSMPAAINSLGNFTHPLGKKYLEIRESQLEERNWKLFHFLLLSKTFWYSFPFTTSRPWIMHPKLFD